jgi:hypothetical protein
VINELQKLRARMSALGKSWCNEITPPGLIVKEIAMFHARGCAEARGDLISLMGSLDKYSRWVCYTSLKLTTMKDPMEALSLKSDLEEFERRPENAVIISLFKEGKLP